MYNDPEPWELMGWHYFATREEANRVQEAWNACPEHIEAVVSEECLVQLRSTPVTGELVGLARVVREHFDLVKKAKDRAKQIIEEVLGRSITVADQFG